MSTEATPRVKIVSDGHVGATTILVCIPTDDGEMLVDISHLVSDVEWSLSARKGVASCWLQILASSVEVEGELRQMVGKRLYIPEADKS